MFNILFILMIIVVGLNIGELLLIFVIMMFILMVLVRDGVLLLIVWMIRVYEFFSGVFSIEFIFKIVVDEFMMKLELNFLEIMEKLIVELVFVFLFDVVNVLMMEFIGLFFGIVKEYLEIEKIGLLLFILLSVIVIVMKLCSVFC